MDPPKTRKEKKKNPKDKKGDGKYSQKHIRITTELQIKKSKTT
jgi:hypothetical protein